MKFTKLLGKIWKNSHATRERSTYTESDQDLGGPGESTSDLPGLPADETGGVSRESAGVLSLPERQATGTATDENAGVSNVVLSASDGSDAAFESGLCGTCTRWLMNLHEVVSTLSSGMSEEWFVEVGTYGTVEDSSSAGCKICMLAIQNFELNIAESLWERPLIVTFSVSRPLPREGVKEQDRIDLRYEASPKAPMQLGGYTRCDLHILRHEAEANPSNELRHAKFTAVDNRSAWLNDALRDVRRYMTACHETHDRCIAVRGHTNPHQALLPTRVLDLFPTDCEGPFRLACDTGEKSAYATLSHCWSESNPPQLTTCNLSQSQRSISADTLSPTIREAILLTRGLGIRYLWIDSLCIIQDDPADWRRESARMADIYSSSAISICPLRGSDRVQSQGILPCHTWTQIDIHNHGRKLFTLQPRLSSADFEIQDSAIEQRAWIMQELILPSTILFVGQQLILDCATCRKTESTGFAPDAHLDFKPAQISLGDEAVAIGKVLEYWYELVTRYTTKALTISTDRPVAIAGVAARIPAPSGYQYLQGIYSNDLQRGLLWVKNRVTTLRPIWQDEASGLESVYTRRGASWSWTTVLGAVEWEWVRRRNAPSTEEIPDIRWLNFKSLVSDTSFIRIDDNELTIQGAAIRGTLVPHSELGFVTSAAFRPLAMEEPRLSWACSMDGKTAETHRLGDECIGMVISSWESPQPGGLRTAITFLLLLACVECSTLNSFETDSVLTLRRVGVCCCWQEVVEPFARTAERTTVCVV